MIRTICADIPDEQLGWCQCHEHLLIADGPSRAINPALWMDDYEKSLAEVQRYRVAGGKSIVDAQPFMCGRMAEQLLRISRESGVNIVCTTGFHKLEFMENPQWVQEKTTEQIAHTYLGELTIGIKDKIGSLMDAKAGVVKCVVVKGGFTQHAIYAKLFEAVARAAKQASAPVMIHFDPDTDAIAVVRFFQKMGVATSKLLLCHLDRTRYDIGYHKELAQTGAFLEYDTIHRYRYHDDEKELALIETMVHEGYASQLLLSLDTTRERLTSYGAAFGLDDILNRFGSMIKKRIGAETLDLMMIKNPAKALHMPERYEREQR